MFTQRFAKNEDKQLVARMAAGINRNLSATVQMLVVRAQLAPAPAPACQNGVCMVTWKPQRTA